MNYSIVTYDCQVAIFLVALENHEEAQRPAFLHTGLAAHKPREATMRYSTQLCPRYQHAIEILGKKWTGLILRVLMDGPQRFNELAEQLEVVSDRMLSERLKELEEEGIVDRQVFPETPVRIEYALTEKGRALGPVLAAVERWAEAWLDVEREVER